MQWWSDFQDWLPTAEGSQAVFVGFVILFSLVVGAFLASWIAAATMRRVHTKRDKEIKTSAVAALIDSATEACVWNSLTPQEQVLSNRAVGLADIRIRMLPTRGAAVAANWAAHQLAEMKRNSATFGYQLEPAIVEFRDRLVDWSVKPAKAKRFFESDLEDWQRAANDTERRLLAEQEAWVAQQHHENHNPPEASPELSFTSRVEFPAAPAFAPSHADPVPAPFRGPASGSGTAADAAQVSALAPSQASAPNSASSSMAAPLMAARTPPAASQPSPAPAPSRTQQLLDDVNALERRKTLVKENGNVPGPTGAPGAAALNKDVDGDANKDKRASILPL